MNPRTRPAAARLPALDMLRAVAVGLVLARHAPLPDSGSAALKSTAAVLMRGGWIGVDLFFVLSGFLVSGLLFTEFRTRGEVRVDRFLIRRGLKIYPAFYFFLGSTLAATVLRHGFGSVHLGAVVSESLFVQNYGPSIWPHTWSLAVEEHFYLLCAGLVVLLTTMRRGSQDPFRPIPYVFAVVAVGSLTARLLTARLAAYTHQTHLFPTHLRLDGLMFGVTLSYLYHFHREHIQRLFRQREVLLSILGMAMLAPAFVFQLETTPFIYTWGLTLFYVGSGLLVVALVLRGLPEYFFVRVLAWVGQYSYSIYLWHIFVFRRAEGMLGRSPLGLALAALVSVVAGVIAAKAVEYPVLAIRDRWYPARSSADAVNARDERVGLLPGTAELP